MELIDQIKRGLPQTLISLETDGDERFYSDPYYEIFFNDIFIIINIHIRVKGYTIPADNVNPEEYIEQKKSIDVEIVEIYICDVLTIQNEKTLSQITKLLINSIEY